MKYRPLTVAVSSALLTIAVSASAIENSAQISVSNLQAVPATQIPSTASKLPAAGKTQRKNQLISEKVFREEKGLAAGDHTYVVLLKDEPLATYKGGVSGLPATSIKVAPSNSLASPVSSPLSLSSVSKAKNTKLKLNAKSQRSTNYLTYLDDSRAILKNKMPKKLGRMPEVMLEYNKGLNGMAMRMTQEEAKMMATMPGVKQIIRETMKYPTTDTGPGFIGAFEIHNGNATGVAFQGEGVVVAGLDQGVNTVNPSFQTIGGDGFVHTNPLGSGTFLGDCVADPSLCNDKLIGVFSFPEVTDQYEGLRPANGEDYNGHGAHTQSTMAGNVVFNTPAANPVDPANPFIFDRLTGVSPHSNVVSFQVCLPGNTGDPLVGCFPSLTAQSVDIIINDGIVDVINYSVGGGSSLPWTDLDSLAFLSAREAGVFVATSAGNSGPGPETVGSPADAPWLTSVGNLFHGRVLGFFKNLDALTADGSTAPPTIEGRSATGSITGNIVYAGNFSNGDPDPEQCLNPFPAGTFTSDQIVLCDRGAIARVAKAENAAAGGAGGFILRNLGPNFLADDVYVVPGIHIDAEDGNDLLAFLSSGSNHQGTISAGFQTSRLEQGDITATSSSRGPNPSVPDILSPNVIAPGTSIFAAFAQENPFSPVTNPSGLSNPYEFLTGTSMSSPHTAGAGALLTGLQPGWTPAEIQSALMLTASQTVIKEDEVTPADFFDMGSGRVRVDLAANSGLVMDESIADYLAANPLEGGDPTTINLASFADSACVTECSWTRTVEATQSNTWSTSTQSISSGVSVTVEPAVFSLNPGETQDITVTANVSGVTADTYGFANVILTPSVPTSPTLTMPLAALASAGNLPDSIDLTARRNASSSLISDLEATAISDLTVRVFGLAKADLIGGSLLGDTDVSSAFDDVTDGVQVNVVTVPEGSTRLVSEITFAESPDLDLFVALDANGDGVPQAEEVVCTSATAASNEFCSVPNPVAGTYFVLVQNFQAAVEGEADDHVVAIAVAGSEDNGNLRVEGQSSIGTLEPFSLRLLVNDNMQEGDRFYGSFDIGTDSANPGNVASVDVNFTRLADDVAFSADSTSVAVGDTVTYTVEIDANTTAEDLTYTVDSLIPSNMSLIADSVSVTAGDVSVNGNDVAWTVLLETPVGRAGSYVLTTNATDPLCVTPFGPGYVNLEDFGILVADGIEGDTVSFNAFADLPINFYGIDNEGGINLTDDGFLFFAPGTPGATPFINTPLGVDTDPNNIIAPFWRDNVIVNDPALNRGVSLASAGPDIIIVEYDDVETFGVPTDTYDFELIMLRQVNDAPGNPEIIMGYDNLNGALNPVTVGVENLDASASTQFLFNNADANVLNNGLLLCYDFQGAQVAGATLTFQATVNSGSGSLTDVSVVNDTSDPGARPVVNTVTLDIAETQANAGVDIVVTEGDLVTLDGGDSIGGNLSFRWKQTKGRKQDTTDPRNQQLIFFAKLAKNGKPQVTDYRLTVTDSEGNRSKDTVTVFILPADGSGTQAIAGSDQTVTHGDIVTLDGGASVGEGLTFSWRQTKGRTQTTLANADTPNPTFQAAVKNQRRVLNVEFRLTVTDADGKKSNDTVSVTINPLGQ